MILPEFMELSAHSRDSQIPNRALNDGPPDDRWHERSGVGNTGSVRMAGKR